MSEETLQHTLNSARILVVDDVVDSLHLLEVILRKAGYHHIRATTDPREVLSLFREWKPDLLLLDLMMPHHDGFEVMEEIQSLIPENTYLPILVLTADISAASKQRALRSGAKDFLTKPFDYIEALLRIDNLLKTRFLHVDLQRQRQQLHDLSLRLVDAQEQERRQVAHELHDEIGQALTAVKINLQSTLRIPGLAALPTATEHFVESVAIIDHAIHQVRDLSFNLRPSVLDDFGLVETLEWCVERIAARGLLEVQFTHENLESRLPTVLETTCFRIAQEALTNVLRHAQATSAEVKLCSTSAEVQLMIQDDGCGFDVKAAQERATTGKSMGVLGMKERAQLIGGQFQIHSVPGKGTTVNAVFPLSDFANHSVMYQGTSL